MSWASPVTALVLLFACGGAVLVATPPQQAARQARSQPTRSTRAAAPAPVPKTEPAQLLCPNPLGLGATSKRAFCDVLTAADAAEGIQVVVPPHRGEASLMFDLHNRQTYSEQRVKEGRAFARYTATIGVRTADNTTLAQLVVQSEFRTETDLFDRVLGGAGPGGLKAVAPTGVESVVVAIPEGVGEVAIVGEQLIVEMLDGREVFSAPGRPIATISNVIVQYRPGPAPTRRR